MNSLELLSKIALLSVNTNNFDYQMNNILKIIGEYTNVSRTYIFINNEDNTLSKNEFEWCNENIIPQIDNLQNLDYTKVPSIKYKLEKEGIIFSDDINKLPKDIINILSPQKIKSILIFPLYINKKIKGFVGYDECIENRNWKEADINLLATISSFISNLYTSFYYSKKIEEDKLYFQNFFNSITDYIFIGNMKGDIIYANKSAIKTFEYSKNILFSMNIIDLYPINKRDAAKQILNTLPDRKTKSCPLEIINKSNKIIPVETRFWLGKWNNEDCIFGLSKDLTKEQEALEKFTKVFKNNPALMALCNMDDKRFIDVNTSFLEKLGYSYQEIIGKTSTELNLFPQAMKHKETANKLAKTGNIKNIELKVRCKDGSFLYGLFSGEIIESQNKQYYLTLMIDISEKKIIEQQLEELSKKDTLTNIYNRRYIFDQLELYLNNFIKTNQIFSITIMDIDFFKNINDTYGHIVGDYVLIEFTKFISKYLKTNQILGRYGGEEFIIISNGESKLDSNKQIYDILSKINQKTFIIKSHKIKFTFSAGISDTLFFNKDTITVEKLINNADERLYKAKKTGRNKISIN